MAQHLRARRERRATNRLVVCWGCKPYALWKWGRIMPFTKGISGNPAGRSGLDPVVRFNLKMAARSYAPEALEVIAKAMRSEDERVRLMAANIMLDRGYGKPKEYDDAETVHRFAELPQVMPLQQWLETRGQPQLLSPEKDDDDPDRKLN